MITMTHAEHLSAQRAFPTAFLASQSTTCQHSSQHPAVGSRAIEALKRKQRFSNIAPGVTDKTAKSPFCQFCQWGAGLCLKNANLENVLYGRLTHRPIRPSMIFSGCVFARPVSERNVMKPITFCGALNVAYETHALSTTPAGRACTSEGRTGSVQCSDGESVRPFRGATLAEVHGRSRAIRNQPSNTVFCDGALGAGRGGDQPRAGSHESSGCGDFARIIAIAAEAIRAAAMAPTPNEALDITGGALLHISALAQASNVDGNLQRAVIAEHSSREAV